MKLTYFWRYFFNFPQISPSLYHSQFSIFIKWKCEDKIVIGLSQLKTFQPFIRTIFAPDYELSMMETGNRLRWKNKHFSKFKYFQLFYFVLLFLIEIVKDFISGSGWGWDRRFMITNSLSFRSEANYKRMVMADENNREVVLKKL